MKETFTISKYVYVYYSNEEGAKGELLMEAQMSPKICVGKNLVVRTVEPNAKETDLGVIENGVKYTKKQSVTLKTDKGWWLVSCNENMEWLMGDSPEFAKCYDD